ncbi:NAD(P)-binding protein [Streptosporangium sp. NPDC001681]|uniref:NAD(P)-binding protein n=1 Tax=Streptosporangium sp. NPDC001681 TaxID=3154395 RepID=UPI0033307EE0
MSHVVVIGAGLGGPAAAGRDVTIVEAGRAPGGCCGTAAVGEYRFDTGPSVLTMPEVLADVFTAAGHATLTVLEPTANLRGGADRDRLTPESEDRLPARLADPGHGDLSRIDHDDVKASCARRGPT